MIKTLFFALVVPGAAVFGGAMLLMSGLWPIALLVWLGVVLYSRAVDRAHQAANPPVEPTESRAKGTEVPVALDTETGEVFFRDLTK